MTPPASAVQRLLSPLVEVRREEAGSLLLMFLYSFLVMTAYNIVKPLTRAQFIGELGADNLPWVLLVSGVVVGVVMQGYTRGASRLPPKAVIAATHVAVAVLLAGFWAAFRIGVGGTAVAFYLVGQILGLLLISQFWVLANDIYDARQAKRLFGFIGGGASLGGMTASAVVVFAVDTVGVNNLLLVSSVLLVSCAGVVTTVLRRAGDLALANVAGGGGEKKGVGGAEAVRMLRGSRHLQLIALIIGFAAIGAGLLDQQLNMAVEEAAGAGGAGRIAAFLGQVQLFLSLAGLVIQVGLTSRIHRHLGIGFALLILPIGLGSTGGLILVTGALWAAAAGRILDSSLRYSVDKTTREILFLPLPADLKHQAKPFIDVTVDRFAKGLGAVLTLVLIQPWGFGLAWRQLSWVSLTVTALWVAAAVRARRQYLASFRQSIARQGVLPAEVRLNAADLSTVETLVAELAHPDERRVLYAIDVLESLDKRHLVTPLLLYHESAAVRARALGALGAASAEVARRWAPAVERLFSDPSPAVRMAAVRALSVIRREDAPAVGRALVGDPDPRIAATAALVLSGSGEADDQRAAARVFATLAADTSAGAAAVRRELAAAVRQVDHGRSRDLLEALLRDPDPAVAVEAMRTIRALKTTDRRYAPALISFLGDRRRKASARETLVGYGEPVVDRLKQVLGDPGEDVWVLRHVPATLARIPCQASMDAVMGLLGAGDHFLRFKALSAAEKLRREHPALTFDPAPVERLALEEGRVCCRRLDQRHALFERGGLPKDAVLAQALDEKTERAVDRIYRLLSLIHGWDDVAAARWAIERGDARARAGALEYLDNVLAGPLRGALLPVLEPLPVDEKIGHARAILKTAPRDAEETLAELFDDEDPVLAAAALHLAGERSVWALRGQVERVLAARDAADAHVVEAASWTLAAHAAAQQGGGGPRRDALPATAVVDRIRTLPLFASVEIEELFRVAAAGRQTRPAAGATVLRAGARPEELHLLLDGEVLGLEPWPGVAGDRPGASPRRLAAPAALGFMEALAGDVVKERVRTAGPALLLTFSDRVLRTLLANHLGLLQGLFRMVATAADIPEGPVRSRAPADLDAFAGPLTEGQKGLALRWVPLFSRVTGDEMRHLTAIAGQEEIEPGTSFTRQTTPAGLAVVLSGAFGLRTGDDERRTVMQAAPGDVVGQRSFAGLDDWAWPARLVATDACSILWIARDDFFDLLSQRPALLQQIFAAWEESPPMERYAALRRQAAAAASESGSPG